MKKTLNLLIVTIIAALFAGCPAGTETNTNANTNAEAPAKDVSTTLIDRDKSASEAWMKKDVEFFEDFLGPIFVMNGSGGVADRAMTMKFMKTMECDIKSTSSSDQKVTELADGVALLVGKSTADGTCGGEKLGDEYFGSLYVKDGETWKAAYYQTAAIPAAEEPKTEEGAKPDDAKKEEEKPAADTEAKKEEAPMKPNLPNDEELAKKFTETETGLWEAWSKKDSKPFEAVMAENFSEAGSQGMMDRAAVLKNIAGNKCDVKSSSISDGKATKINDDFVIFTYTGKASGTCDGNAMPDVPLYTTTIWKKDGDNWKAVFHMTSPGMKAA